MVSITRIKTRKGGQERWRVRFCRNGERSSKTFAQREAARAFDQQMQRKLSDHVSPRLLLATVYDAYHHWQKHHAPTLATATQKTEDAHIARFAQRFGSCNVEMLDARQVRGWLDGTTQRNGWSKATAERSRQSIVAMLNVAVRDGVSGSNPLSGKLPLTKGRASKPRRAPSSEEAAKLVQDLRRHVAHAPEEAWIFAASLIASVTGVRRSEIFALLKTNYSQGTLTVNRALCSIKNTPKTTKTDDQRVFPLPPNVAHELERYLATLPPTVVHVFPSPVHPTEPRNSGQAGKRINALYKKLGYKNLTLHCWRHGLCSSLVASGLPYESIRQISGHRSRAAFDRYVHANIEHNGRMLLLHTATFLPGAAAEQPKPATPAEGGKI